VYNELWPETKVPDVEEQIVEPEYETKLMVPPSEEKLFVPEEDTEVTHEVSPIGGEAPSIVDEVPEYEEPEHLSRYETFKKSVRKKQVESTPSGGRALPESQWEDTVSQILQDSLDGKIDLEPYRTIEIDTGWVKRKEVDYEAVARDHEQYKTREEYYKEAQEEYFELKEELKDSPYWGQKLLGEMTAEVIDPKTAVSIAIGALITGPMMGPKMVQAAVSSPALRAAI